MSMRIQQRAEKTRAMAGSVRTLLENANASKLKRFNLWQHSYSLHICQQSAVLGAAEAYMVDMVQHVKQSRYYRHRVKFYVNQLNTSTLEEWHTQFSNGAGIDILCEIIDGSKEALQKDINILFYSIKSEMDKERWTDAMLRAEVYMVNLLVDMSCFLWELHSKIGPRPETVTEEQAEYLRQQMHDFIEGRSDIDSPFFDSDYVNWIHGLKPEKLQSQMRNISEGVCGKWHHSHDGNVYKSLSIIIRKITDTEWLNSISLRGLINSGMYAEEIKRLDRMDSFRLGAVEITLDLLDAVRAYSEGYTDEEIRAALLETNPNLTLMPAHLERIMSVVQMMRLIDEHPESQQMINELEHAYEHGGRAEAERVHRRQLRDEKKRKATKATASVEPVSERESMIARLSQNFKVIVKNVEHEQHEVTVDIDTDSLIKSAADVPNVDESLELSIQPPKPSVTRQRWSTEEEEYMMQAWAEGVSPGDIAMKLHRTEHAVRCRRSKIVNRPEVESEGCLEI